MTFIMHTPANKGGKDEFNTRLGSQESSSQVSQGKDGRESGIQVRRRATKQSPRRPGVGFYGVPSATGLTGRLSCGKLHCQVRREADYIARLKAISKVLDFVKFGGRSLTAMRTFWLEVGL